MARRMFHHLHRIPRKRPLRHKLQRPLPLRLHHIPKLYHQNLGITRASDPFPDLEVDVAGGSDGGRVERAGRDAFAGLLDSAVRRGFETDGGSRRELEIWRKAVICWVS